METKLIYKVLALARAIKDHWDPDMIIYANLFGKKAKWQPSTNIVITSTRPNIVILNKMMLHLLIELTILHNYADNVFRTAKHKSSEATYQLVLSDLEENSFFAGIYAIEIGTFARELIHHKRSFWKQHPHKKGDYDFRLCKTRLF